MLKILRLRLRSQCEIESIFTGVLTVLVSTGKEAVVSEFLDKSVKLDAKLGYVDFLVDQISTESLSLLDEIGKLVTQSSFVIYRLILVGKSF